MTKWLIVALSLLACSMPPQTKDTVYFDKALNPKIVKTTPDTMYVMVVKCDTTLVKVPNEFEVKVR